MKKKKQLQFVNSVPSTHNNHTDGPVLRLRLHQPESIDETAPMLNNLLNCINESVIDIGKCGLVILKYKQSGRFDEKIYNESAKSLSAFELHTLSDGTCLGNLSSQVFHYGQIFYMKILQLRQNRSATRSTAVKTPKAPASLSASPNFVHVTRVFTGTYPFKIQEVVSTQEIGSIPADPRRAISLLIKHVLSQIFDGEKVHQKFAIRSHHGRNKKNDDLQDLPRDVLCFIKVCQRIDGETSIIVCPRLDL
ncbi:hypothetical protein L3Y34_015546 [Caenorhabditis briggsae]|uniref:Uncharacterized protein n=1 Tax=Caenorhabditis briggsae TaxID=6238 RepID=A0AAE9DU04_CAEBR|nr:hypothetical protein L3Y34_015546 [Caenorhabditis briggsae]